MAEITYPPLIVALDTDSVETSLEVIDMLSAFPAEDLGIKIPRWHDQSESLRKVGAETGRYVVLDTQLNDGATEMVMGARSILSQTDSSGKPLLPNAITMSPVKEIGRHNWQKIEAEIVSFAKSLEKPVQVISHADQTRYGRTEDILHEKEIDDCLGSGRLGFSIFELHADTALSERFRGAYGGPEPPRCVIFASRFGTSEQSSEEEIINRIARCYRRGVVSAYVGKSIMSSAQPVDYIQRILKAHEDAVTQPLSDEAFEEHYSTPVSSYRGRIARD